MQNKDLVNMNEFKFLGMVIQLLIQSVWVWGFNICQLHETANWKDDIIAYIQTWPQRV